MKDPAHVGLIGCDRTTAVAIECAEAQTAASQHETASPAVTGRLGLSCKRFGAISLILTRRSENLYFNRVIGLGMSSPTSERQLERMFEQARAQRCKRLAVDLSPFARPRRVDGWLRSRGFEPGHPGAKHWRGNEPLAPLPRGTGARLRVRRVRGADRAAWVDVVSSTWRSFGFRREWYEGRATAPGWRHYLAWDGEIPVGTGAMFVAELGSRRVGHLVDGTTLRSHRRRGVQRAIIRKRLSEGLKLGCELFTSETAPPLPRMPLVSFRNLRREGFSLAYVRESWVGAP